MVLDFKKSEAMVSFFALRDFLSKEDPIVTRRNIDEDIERVISL